MAGLSKNKQIAAGWLGCFTALFFAPLEISGQHNLVRNGGFEDVDTCPYSLAQLHFASPWTGIGSPELFHSCSPSYLGTPMNYMGFQHPKSGNGYAGMNFAGFYNNTFVSHEYLQIKLLEILKADQHYCYRLFVSPTRNNLSRFVIDEFSVVLSDTAISWNTWTSSQPHNYCNYLPTHTCYTGFTTDTSMWYEVMGDFIARGGEQYLTIGYFKIATHSDIFWLESPNTPFNYAYYYIDDVSLWYCGPDTIPEPELPTELILPVIPNVFTPNGDGYNDLFAFKNHEGWELETYIRNRWGKLVYEGKNDLWWDGMINGQPAPEGVYYYTVIARNHFGQHKTFNGVVTLLR